MRYRTFAAKRSVLAGIIAVAMVAGVAPAFGQNLIVACKSTDCTGYGGAGMSPYTDLQDAIDDAVTLAANVGQVTVLIVEDDTGAPWSGVALNIPADANIRILGVPDDVAIGGAFSVILEGTGAAPVITIDGTGLTEPTNLLEIEGITLTGGTDGVLVTGTTDAGNATPYSPTINRCYIRENIENGVRIEGNAEPFLVNNSINRNPMDGVHVGDGIGGIGAYADILHCSILENGSNGVYVEAGNDARVRNTLVYRNGNVDGEGGLVWETNAFINPDVGPVAGGTAVTINGANFGAGAGDVYFGPPNRADTVAAIAAWGDTQITCVTPPAWTGNPGPVDVYIVRSDGSSQVVRNGFTYEEPGGVFPIVSHVVPEWGPETGQNWVYVYGANFDHEPEVRFDGLSALNVLWINSGQLLVKVPASVPGKVEVQVTNANGNTSAITPPADYEYRATTELAPNIMQITPNYYRSPAGSGPNTSVVALADIVGFFFADDAVVKIGGIVCPHGGVSIANASTTPPLVQIVDVQIPVAQFGASGAYDVEVINPSGIRDVLPNGFTYYADGIPGLDPDSPAGLEEVWRVANFVEKGVGGTRQLYGFNFDFAVDVVADPGGIVGGPYPLVTAGQPIAQRYIDVTFPLNESDPPLAPLVTEAVEIGLTNTAPILPGNTSTAVLDSARTTMYYANARVNPNGVNEATYFQIDSVAAATSPGNPDNITVNVLNFQLDMEIYVGDVLVPQPYTLTSGSVGLGISGSATFPAPAQPAGVWGPVDVRVEAPPNSAVNAFSDTLYYVLEDAYSYRRPDDPPEVYSVLPRTAPVANTHFKVLGANFVGPPASGIFTRLVLVWPSGNEITIQPGSPGVTNYEVTSFSEINFDFDLSDPTYLPGDYPPGAANPVDVRAEQVEGGVVLNDTSGNPLASTLLDALYFDAGPPVITDVDPNEGPVSGFDPIAGVPTLVTITGTGFGATAPIVRFGSAEALVVDIANLPTEVTVELPAAQQGLPGIYDVFVIRPADQQQGVLRDAFTYYLDGRPVITEIERNHAEYDPADITIRYVTIRGYNFDDIVRVTFTDPSPGANPPDERSFYSVSPYEIVVSLPDFPSLIVPPGGVARLEVTVQNAPLVYGSGDPEAAGLTSNPVDFFVYDDVRGDVNPANPEFAFNDVYFNWEDYINTQPGVGSISVDPMLDVGPDAGGAPIPGPKFVAPQPGGWWYGKLLATDLASGEFRDNPIRNKGGEFVIEPFTSADFEYEPRPDPPQNEQIQGTGNVASTLPDIGADEINGFNDASCGWIFARPTPNPVGALDAGDVLVEIRVTPGCINPVAFIVPQGANPELVQHRIRLDLITRLGAGGYLYRTGDDIRTILVDSDADGEPSQGDYLMDGHAAIYLVDVFDNSNPPNIIGYDETTGLGSLRESGLIQGQAVYGRHFIIDTIPPRVRIESGTYGTNGFDNAIVASSAVGIVNAHSDNITANDANPLTHPFPLPPALLSDGTRWDPANVFAPVDYLGAITLPPLAGVDGTKVFFNSGSRSNESAASPPLTNLAFTATVEFIDPPVTDEAGNEIAGNVEDEDIFTNRVLTARQRSGFLLLEPMTDAFDIGAGRWLYANGTSAALLAGAPVVGTYATTFHGAGPGGNQGVYDPAYLQANGDAVPPPPVGATELPVFADGRVANEVLIPTWMIQAPGIDWNLAANNTYHVEARMIAEDLAGNATPDEEKFDTDPLHIWWLLDVQSRLVPDREGQATNRPTFTMQLTRTEDPQAEGGPVPIFSYRVYSSLNYAGVYNPVTDWTPWSASTSIATISSLPGLLGQWVLVVSQGADEAGNVEPWPPVMGSDDGPIDLSPSGGVLDELARQLPNWQRFMFSGVDAPDTRVVPTFWHDLDADGVPDGNEPNFGQSRLVPLPDNLTVVPVRALFQVSTVRPPGVPAGPIRVQIEFIEAGTLVPQVPNVFPTPPAAFTSDTQVLPVVASSLPAVPDPPYEVMGTNGIFLGDVPLRQQPVTYVFRASAFFDLDNSGTFNPDPLVNPLEIMDPTPANVYFTVVPTGVPNYIQPSTDEDSQPIKEQEIR